MSDRKKVISLKDHGRAAPSIRRAKAVGGLGGFAVAAFLGFAHGAPFAATAERALEVGIGGNIAAWSLAVLFWKRLLVAEAGATAARMKAKAEEAS